MRNFRNRPTNPDALTIGGTALDAGEAQFVKQQKNYHRRIAAMARKLFVGNLNWAAKENQIRELFEKYGKVLSVRLPIDRDTDRPRGFAFVEMETDAQAGKAIEALHGTVFMTRDLLVDIAKPSNPNRRG